MSLLAYLPDAWLRVMRAHGPLWLRVAAANEAWRRAAIDALCDEQREWWIG